MSQPSSSSSASLSTSRTGPSQWRPVLVGGGAALVSLLLILVPIMSAWAGDSRSGGSWTQALGLGAAAWLGTLGGHPRLAGVTISFVPLALVLLPVALSAWSWRRVLRASPVDSPVISRLLPKPVVVRLCGWFAGFVGVVGLAYATTFLGPARLSPAWIPVTVAAVPLGGALIATVSAADEDSQVLGYRLDRSRLPTWLRRAFAPAVRGVIALVGAGGVLVLTSVALHWDRVLTVQAAVGGGVAGGVVLGALQLAALPNMAMWAVSFLAGPGFSAVDGASVDWSGVQTGLMPLIPVLAAHPQPATYPWFVRLVVFVPVLVGGLVGRWSIDSIARLSSVATKAKVATTACTMTAVLTAGLNAVGGSSLGNYRMAEIGAPSALLAGVLALELATGALVVVGWDAWRLRR